MNKLISRRKEAKEISVNDGNRVGEAVDVVIGPVRRSKWIVADTSTPNNVNKTSVATIKKRRDNKIFSSTSAPALIRVDHTNSANFERRHSGTVLLLRYDTSMNKIADSVPIFTSKIQEANPWFVADGTRNTIGGTQICCSSITQSTQSHMLGMS